MTIVGNRLFFTAYTSSLGQELWVLDTAPAAPVIDDQSFATADHAPNGTVVGTVVTNGAGVTPTFQIAGGNTNGAFAINSATDATDATAANSFFILGLQSLLARVIVISAAAKTW